LKAGRLHKAAMPELPEVETVARGLRSTLEGRVITRVLQNRPNLRIPFPDNLVKRLTGRRVTHVGRRAKYILLTLDDGNILIVHLGMSGRFIFRRDPSQPLLPHDHLVLTADDGVDHVLNDPRRFGLVAMTEAARLDEHKLFAGLGPEPLGNTFDGPTLAERIAGKNTPIKAALLDQRVVAGLGNIYVCEALFQSGISPTRLAGTIKGARAERLVQAIRQVLNAAIAAGGSTLRDFMHHNGELGYFQHSFSVYAREGKPCPGCTCDVAQTGGIARIVQSGRSTFYCPHKQR
jgi:formamidopyrimidine-DNA glycosylase